MEISNRWIVVIVVSVLVLFSGCSLVSTNNIAIGYEESIENAKSGIQVQEKREYDLITKLVQVVEANSKYEQSTLLLVTQARTAVKNGNIEQAMSTINIIVEQYPDLKANTAYFQLMTELSISENLKTQFRNTYNDNVKEYSQHVRRFPNALFLNIMGYEVIKYDYLEFEETELPDELFIP